MLSHDTYKSGIGRSRTNLKEPVHLYLFSPEFLLTFRHVKGGNHLLRQGEIIQKIGEGLESPHQGAVSLSKTMPLFAYFLDSKRDEVFSQSLKGFTYTKQAYTVNSNPPLQ